MIVSELAAGRSEIRTLLCMVALFGGNGFVMVVNVLVRWLCWVVCGGVVVEWR